MKVENFVEVLQSDFYTGVPDSLLKPLCDYLMHKYGISKKHIIAANEGNCTALAAGYHLATGKIPVVYMQNSGEGNSINPMASLLNDKVYGIPCVFVIGWRGEPGVHDEPQHIFQGEVTLKLLEDMGIQSFIIDEMTTEEEFEEKYRKLQTLLMEGKSIAFVVRKGALHYEEAVEYENDYTLCREEIIRQIANIAGADPIIATTGKTSRELFEIREEKRQDHKYDFLTVGSMGHSSSIALGIALSKPNQKIWCIDGDGAILMHMGAMAVIGSEKPENLVHIVINNGAHETVGGMPTVAKELEIAQIAEGCGYPKVLTVATMEELMSALSEARSEKQLMLIEIKTSIGSRKNLGRPTTSALENKINFMEYLSGL